MSLVEAREAGRGGGGGAHGGGGAGGIVFIPDCWSCANDDAEGGNGGGKVQAVLDAFLSHVERKWRRKRRRKGLLCMI